MRPTPAPLSLKGTICSGGDLFLGSNTATAASGTRTKRRPVRPRAPRLVDVHRRPRRHPQTPHRGSLPCHRRRPAGSGRSEPQPRLYEKTYYHDDAEAFLALLRHLDADPAHLVGFSDGGEYALVMAEQDPSSVRSVFTWGAAGSMSADTGIAEFFRDLVDNPSPGGERFAEGLKKTYGAETPDHESCRRSGFWRDHRGRR